MKELLQVNGLVKAFGQAQAVKGISFHIQEGRCTALLGPNGAGKTTTIRMLTGLLKPTAGSIQFHGLRAGEDRRSLLGYLPQSPAFHNWMSGMEYVVYAGRLCGLSPAEAKQRAKELLERVGLAEAAKRRIGGYSGGMKQRLGLAQALVHRPKLLVMDEPVSALDPIGRREVLGLLKELKSETTVLFSTHVLHDAEELCDDVIIIRSGQVALQGALPQIRSEHRRPIIELKLEEHAPSLEWAAGFEQRTSADERLSATIEEIERQGTMLRLTVKDMDKARQALTEELAKEKVRFSRLEAGYSSLEDLFMKVVGE
ncbi:ABC transporter ATP-binding protein [Paenibacillus nanensis]|uniref:ABC transporter ATP-binding protein n=1 Tax=Paenibacillus nanensis TaxID=393251 RepID=A0A3A1UR76_9BACL|nr:ABC transporter ATP-binding protein [Paenibacillus nanensis]RIX50754.1 ABC transporter ATP-binding protein [Paenibacillus nanensis]